MVIGYNQVMTLNVFFGKYNMDRSYKEKMLTKDNIVYRSNISLKNVADFRLTNEPIRKQDYCVLELL